MNNLTALVQWQARCVYLEGEVERLRELLRECLRYPHMLSLARDYSPMTADFHSRIDAALKEKK
jgi:hypothetical protein